MRRRDDRGSATLELAVAMPAVVLLLAVVLGAADVVVAQVDCVDAARAGARAAARGETAAVVRASAQSLAPAGASVAVRGGAGTVVVEVTSRRAVLGRLGGAVLTGATARAAVEPAAAGVAP
ncbi:TadE family type IV pilus minor pilin [Kineococcus rubinsiae]|uniref:TadE family type IV pilus minor pilin n=1 Tax=Kineococcus rubinsiae TaxID=2609562 RepID=UPI0014304C33|nr:TadE family type IV pilus minor pilin [Kineococcus rubinsiae]NIZ91589.1 pilus assembly protein TadE [Kineococcus rubinsiae]